MKSKSFGVVFKLANEKYKAKIKSISLSDQASLAARTGENQTTARCYALGFLRLLYGYKFSQSISVEALEYGISRIEKLYGEEGKNRAIAAIQLHVKSNPTKHIYRQLIQTITGGDQTEQQIEFKENDPLLEMEVANIYNSLGNEFISVSESRTKTATRAGHIFLRNPEIIAKRLFHARGRCEMCKNKAPFLRKSTGIPYLEVHHIVPLYLGGEDSFTNTMAICPNCHRKEHFG